MKIGYIACDYKENGGNTDLPADNFKAGDADCSKIVDLTDAKLVLKLAHNNKIE